MAIGIKSFENSVGKGENAGNQHFLNSCFSTMFSHSLEANPVNIYRNIHRRSANSLSLDEFKIFFIYVPAQISLKYRCLWHTGLENKTGCQSYNFIHLKRVSTQISKEFAVSQMVYCHNGSFPSQSYITVHSP